MPVVKYHNNSNSEGNISKVGGQEFVNGSKMEKMFYTVKHLGVVWNHTTHQYETDTRGTVRYTSPMCYFKGIIKELESLIENRIAKKPSPSWGEDIEDAQIEKWKDAISETQRVMVNEMNYFSLRINKLMPDNKPPEEAYIQVR